MEDLKTISDYTSEIISNLTHVIKHLRILDIIIDWMNDCTGSIGYSVMF